MEFLTTKPKQFSFAELTENLRYTGKTVQTALYYKYVTLQEESSSQHNANITPVIIMWCNTNNNNHYLSRIIHIMGYGWVTVSS